MSVIIIIQIIIALLFFILGWAIRKKKAYWLISGFNNRSEDEKQQLIDNAYPQRMGLWLILTAIGIIILLPLSFTALSFTFEIQFGFILLSSLVGMIYLSKYETLKKRKRQLYHIHFHLCHYFRIHYYSISIRRTKKRIHFKRNIIRDYRNVWR